jgi:hypothetical protein
LVCVRVITQLTEVGESMRPTPSGSVPLQPGGTIAHTCLPVPLVRVPGAA